MSKDIQEIVHYLYLCEKLHDNFYVSDEQGTSTQTHPFDKKSLNVERVKNSHLGYNICAHCVLEDEPNVVQHLEFNQVHQKGLMIEHGEKRLIEKCVFLEKSAKKQVFTSLEPCAMCTCILHHCGMNITQVSWLMNEPLRHFENIKAVIKTPIVGKSGDSIISNLLNRGFELFKIKYPRDNAPDFLQTNYAFSVFGLGKKFLSIINADSNQGLIEISTVDLESKVEKLYQLKDQIKNLETQENSALKTYSNRVNHLQLFAKFYLLNNDTTNMLQGDVQHTLGASNKSDELHNELSEKKTLFNENLNETITYIFQKIETYLRSDISKKSVMMLLKLENSSLTTLTMKASQTGGMTKSIFKFGGVGALVIVVAYTIKHFFPGTFKKWTGKIFDCWNKCTSYLF
jgi:hypothetical protein